MKKPTISKFEQLYNNLQRIREEEEDMRNEILHILQEYEMRYQSQSEFFRNGVKEEPENLIREFNKGYTVFQWQVIQFEEDLIEKYMEPENLETWPHLFFIHAMYLNGRYKYLKDRVEDFIKWLPDYEEHIPQPERNFLSTVLTKAAGHLKFLRIHFTHLHRYSPQLNGRLDLATPEESKEGEKRAGRPPKEKINYKMQFAALEFYIPELYKKLWNKDYERKDRLKVIHLITGASISVIDNEFFGQEREELKKPNDPNKVNKTEWPKLE
jgi:hypothetical protein